MGPLPEPEPELEPGQCAVDYDARYSTGWAYGKKPNAFLVDAANAWLLADDGAPRCHAVGVQPPRVLSLGEGQGRNVVFLAEHGYQCLAVDISTIGLDKARTLAAQRGVSDLVQTCAADLTAFEPGVTFDGFAPGQWDVILSIFCGLPPAPRARLHRSCVESLAPGGIVIIECFAPTPAAVSADEAAQSRSFRPGPPESERVSHTQLAAELAGLQVLFAREVTRPLNEGRFHRGVVTLTQFVARLPCAVKSELPSPRRFARYCASIDAVFDEAQLYQRGRSDSEVAASAAAAYQLAAKTTCCDSTSQDVELDALLFSARALLSVTCAAAVRGKICRYCWVPQVSCFCQQLAAVSCRVRSAAAVETTATQTTSSERSTPDRGSSLKSRKIRWVIITHPSEFLRSSSTARLAAALLGSDHCTPATSRLDDMESETETEAETELFRSIDCELLVFGSARHEASLREVVGSAVPPLVLFPLPAGQSETPAEALTCMRRVDRQSACTATGSEDATTVTVLVPDGSWDCARALVRALIALRCSLTASNGAPGSPLRFIRLSDNLVAHHTSSIIDALRTGAGKGRLSTLEAMAMVPVEAATTTNAAIRRASSPLIGDCADSAQPHGPDTLLPSVLALVGHRADFQAAFAGLALLVSFVETQNALYSEPPEFSKVSPPPRYVFWCTICRAVLY